jgi:Uncharacterized proteins of the AP superfamily
MNSGLHRWITGAALVCASIAAPARAVAQVRRTAGAAASLVVLLVVDQMIPDYFDRYGAQLTGGLARLQRSGAFFTHGMQDHAITQTAPGHATLLSGRPPSSTGIITNDDGVGDPGAPLIDAPGWPGASPRNFRGTALYDWMLVRDADARVLAVSGKDRGAILPVGRARGEVYWFAGGEFTTSRYYADTLPAWVRAFNDRRSAARLAGRRWELLLPAANYPEPDSMPWERRGRDISFPHVLPPAAAIDTGLKYYPWADSLALDFALEGVRQTRLGQRLRPDLLVVSLSTTDEVGHDWGRTRARCTTRSSGSIAGSAGSWIPSARWSRLRGPMSPSPRITGRRRCPSTIGRCGIGPADGSGSART